MTPESVPYLAAVFHITTVESFAIWAFYGTFIANLIELASFNYLWMVEFPEAERAGKLHVGSYDFCVWNDMNEAVFSLDTKFNSTCANLDNMNNQDWNLWGITNYVCLGLCVLSFVWLQLKMFLQTNMDVCSGAYLVHKLHMERGCASRLIAYGMLCYIIVLYALCIPTFDSETYEDYAAVTTVDQGYFIRYIMAMLFRPTQIPGMLVVIGAARSLSTDYEPCFDYESDEFEKLRFRRTWYGLFTQGSVNFMRDFERAVLLGHAGLPQELEPFLASREDVKHVLHVCRMRCCLVMQGLPQELKHTSSDSDSSED